MKRLLRNSLISISPNVSHKGITEIEIYHDAFLFSLFFFGTKRRTLPHCSGQQKMGRKVLVQAIGMTTGDCN